MRDWGRFGQFILDGGRIDGKALLPADWLPQATAKQIDIGRPGMGYGYFWWTNDDGTFDGRGIFGQTIHIDPKRRAVTVILSAWDAAIDPARGKERARLMKAINASLDS